MLESQNSPSFEAAEKYAFVYESSGTISDGENSLLRFVADHAHINVKRKNASITPIATLGFAKTAMYLMERFAKQTLLRTCITGHNAPRLHNIRPISKNKKEDRIRSASLDK